MLLPCFANAPRPPRGRRSGVPGSLIVGATAATRSPGALRIGLFMALAVGILSSSPGRVGAQEGGSVDPETISRPELRVLPGTGIVIDGVMNESAWAAAEPIEDFIQAEPAAGQPASERTEVRITFDEDNLYVGATMYDSDPSGLIFGGLERDSPGILFEEMDAFGITLDTFLDRRNSFIFFVNPKGGLKDGQGSDDGRARDYGWDGVVDVRTTVHDEGWTLEMAIPWRTLRFDPRLPDQRWGLNLMRRIRRKNEVSYWAPLDRRNRIFLMSRAGTLSGMGRLPAGRNLSVKPFALASRASGSALATGVDGGDFDGGVDVKYGITPGLTLDLTWRTDFSQVEVDQEQVNLSRFPLFFPERREFFLENSGTFTFGDLGPGPGGPRTGTSLRDLTLFHSRQIGLRGGSPVPLLGGTRLTGRAGSLELGAMNVQSEAFGDEPAENFSVVRLRRSVMDNSDVGVIFTNRQATGVSGGGANRAFGVDANLRLFGSLYLNSYLAGTDSREDRDRAARLSMGWRDRFWNASAAFRQVGEGFEPGIGFVRRRAIRESYATVGIHPRLNVPRVLEVNPYLESSYVTDLDGRLESRTGRGGFGVSFDDRSSLNFTYTRRFERLVEPFLVRGETSVPARDYRFGEGSVSYRSSQGRALSANFGVSGGGFYDGTRFSLSGGARWQPDYRVVLDVDATHNALSVQGDDFTADLYSARVQYAYSTTLNFSGFVQYNADVDEIVTNLRANLIHAPLSDLFLLYTERRGAAGGAALERFVTVKFTRMLLF